MTKILKPGGRVVIVEFHPVASMFDEDLKMGWNYDNNREPFREEEGIGDYVAFTGDTFSGYEPGVENFRNPEYVYEWAWGIGDVVTALITAGLELTVLREWTYMNGWKRYHQMKQLPGRRWALPDGMPNMPLMYGLVARKRSGAS